MLKIGHRGAHGYEPENTLISFQKALDLGVDGIELDVHLSADKKVVVIHDETIDRTTNGHGIVNQMVLSQLQQYKILKRQKIPTLIKVFDLVNKKCFINIELKGKGTPKPVIDLVEDYIVKHKWSYNDFIISSFDWEMLVETKNYNPKIPIAVLIETSIKEALAFAKTIQATAINPDYMLLNDENIKEIKAAGFKIFPWTVNEPEVILEMKNFKVDGIISDYPDRL